VSAPVVIRKSGARVMPWEARCRECGRIETETYVFPHVGAVAFSTRGIGNRLWELAMLAALAHLHRHHGGALPRLGVQEC
jgi:hypothetical protein